MTKPMKNIAYITLGIICLIEFALYSGWAHAQQSNSLPDGDIYSSEFITMGCGFSSLQECDQIELDITASDTQTELIIDVMNGNMEGGIYNQPLLTDPMNPLVLPTPEPTTLLFGIQGATGDAQLDINGQVPLVQNQMIYDLYLDNILIDTVNGDNLGEIADGFDNAFTIPNIGENVYTLVLRIDQRNPEIDQIYHMFKLSANGQFSTNSKIGFVNKDYRLPLFIGIPSNMLSDNKIEFDFLPEQYEYEPGKFIVCAADIYGGDYDKSTDTKKPLQPAVLPFPINADTVAEGANPGDPPDSTINVTILDPDGTVIAFDDDPSGDKEWELTRIASSDQRCQVNLSTAHVVLPRLQQGVHTVVVDNMQQDNVIFNVLPAGIVVMNECKPCTGLTSVTIKMSEWSLSRDTNERVRVRVGSMLGRLSGAQFDAPVLYDGRIANGSSITLSIPEEYVGEPITITVQGQYHEIEYGKAAFDLNCDLQIGSISGNSYIKFKIDSIEKDSNDVCETGGQGCTPEYWRQSQHFTLWNDYGPQNRFRDAFGTGTTSTLYYNLQDGGGANRAFRRHAVAALLNASHPNVNYFKTTAQVIDSVKKTYVLAWHTPSDQRDPIWEEAKNILEEQNKLLCQISSAGDD